MAIKAWRDKDEGKDKYYLKEAKFGDSKIIRRNQSSNEFHVELVLEVCVKDD
jgi:hypothetical protein